MELCSANRWSAEIDAFKTDLFGILAGRDDHFVEFAKAFRSSNNTAAVPGDCHPLPVVPA